MRVLLPAIVLTAMAASVSAEDEAATEATVESAFVACLADKQPDLIGEIRDAESQEGFEAAMKTGLELCPTDVAKLSMGKLFRALNAHGKADTETGE